MRRILVELSLDFLPTGGYMPEKLVRDRIPEIMKKEGLNPDFRIADVSEMLNLLLTKLIEEAQEAARAGDLDKLLEELGDVEDVHDEILKLILPKLGIDRLGYRKRLLTKHDTKGRFYKRIVLK